MKFSDKQKELGFLLLLIIILFVSGFCIGVLYSGYNPDKAKSFKEQWQIGMSFWDWD